MISTGWLLVLLASAVVLLAACLVALLTLGTRCQELEAQLKRIRTLNAERLRARAEGPR